MLASMILAMKAMLLDSPKNSAIYLRAHLDQLRDRPVDTEATAGHSERCQILRQLLPEDEYDSAVRHRAPLIDLHERSFESRTRT